MKKVIEFLKRKRGKISLNTIYPANGLKYMYMRKSKFGSTHNTFSNNIWKLRILKLFKK